ncbi:MAG: hypothetical protein GTN98_13345 [Woeseiaceae bacterium]|nr:hypothetical protein [Woeseiaceae bacterium]
MTLRVVIILAISGIAGCTALPGGEVSDAALVVYTEGSRHDTLAATVPADAAIVYASFARIIEAEEGVEIIHRKDNAMMMEVKQGEYSITSQVTRFGESKSLLYIWADAGDSGRTGRDLATAVVERICEEVGVPYEVVEY